MGVRVLEGGDYRLTFDADAGGILRSLTWRGLDLLRPSPDGSSDPLQSAMFPLVPFSNRLSAEPLIDGVAASLPRYIEGEPFAIHGFGWQLAWEVAEEGPSMAELHLEDERSPWPSSYRAIQRLALDENGFTANLCISNKGTAPLPAGIGFHPYFPVGDAEMAMGIEGKWEKDSRGLPESLVPSGWERGAFKNVGDTRLDHSFSGWDGTAHIRWPVRNLSVELTASGTLREAVIYVPDDDYFCVEPVSHLTDAMFAKDPAKQRGWRVLAPGQTLSGSMTLSASTL